VLSANALHVIIVYKMASLLALMNRAITYFKEPKSVTGETSEAGVTSAMSGTNSDVSTDDESVMNSDGMSTYDIITYEDIPKSQCSICRGYAYIQYYNYERQIWDDCCLLTEEDEK
jgi:hypothetical protein